MKLSSSLIVGLTLSVCIPAFSQQAGSSATLISIPQSNSTVTTAPKSQLTKFDLDFPGGTPGELVAAVRQATGRPLNAIVPSEYAMRRLPPVKMRGVNAEELFTAMIRANSVRILDRLGNDQGYRGESGFMTADTHPSDDSVWYFYVSDPSAQAGKECKFYLLTPYLERGLTVDDITTAIQTGWKMLGDTSPPAISFHKETNLLIAVGEARQLETIDAALRALNPPNPNALNRGIDGLGAGRAQNAPR